MPLEIDNGLLNKYINVTSKCGTEHNIPPTQQPYEALPASPLASCEQIPTIYRTHPAIHSCQHCSIAYNYLFSLDSFTLLRHMYINEATDHFLSTDKFKYITGELTANLGSLFIVVQIISRNNKIFAQCVIIVILKNK